MKNQIYPPSTRIITKYFLFVSLRDLRGRIVFALIIVILLALTTSQPIAPASAQSGGTYDLTWNSIDGGGAMFSTGGTYSLGGTIGQFDAAVLMGGTYSLGGGFWGGAPTIFNLSLPIIVR